MIFVIIKFEIVIFFSSFTTLVMKDFIHLISLCVFIFLFVVKGISPNISVHLNASAYFQIV